MHHFTPTLLFIFLGEDQKAHHYVWVGLNYTRHYTSASTTTPLQQHQGYTFPSTMTPGLHLLYKIQDLLLYTGTVILTKIKMDLRQVGPKAKNFTLLWSYSDKKKKMKIYTQTNIREEEKRSINFSII